MLQLRPNVRSRSVRGRGNRVGEMGSHSGDGLKAREVANHLAAKENLNRRNAADASVLHRLFVARDLHVDVIDLTCVLPHDALDDGLHDLAHCA